MLDQSMHNEEKPKRISSSNKGGQVAPGDYTRELILEISECSRHHKKDTTVPNQVVLDNRAKTGLIYTLMRSSLIDLFVLNLDKYL